MRLTHRTAGPSTFRNNEMGDFHPQCAKCGQSMDRGHLPDVAHGMVVQSTWAPGDVEKRRFVGGIKYKKDGLIPLTAYRCRSCGYVELYARPE